jgi:hypothetical protein
MVNNYPIPAKYGKPTPLVYKYVPGYDFAVKSENNRGFTIDYYSLLLKEPMMYAPARISQKTVIDDMAAYLQNLTDKTRSELEISRHSTLSLELPEPKPIIFTFFPSTKVESIKLINKIRLWIKKRL